MIKYLVRYSLRSFKRQRAYIIINILGLSIGIACSLFIAFYILNELSFDKYNFRYKRIFRLIQNTSYTEEFTASFCPAILGPTLLREVPEVEGFLRMFRRMPVAVEYDGQVFTEEHLVESDSSFFNFFSIPVLMGDSRNLLNAPRKAVLSEPASKKIFGDKNPIDKILKIGSDSIGYTITGVMADIPGNSHFEANILLSFMTNPGSNAQVWTNNSYSTYVLLKQKTDFSKVDEKISELVSKYVGAEIQQELGISMSEWIARGHKYRYYLQNLSKIHLDPSIQQEFKEAGDPKYLMIIGGLAVLIILIAAINFMNLTTAQASRREKEVGIKKVSGSTRTMLIVQFFTESFIITFVSMIIALIFIKVALPYLNNLLKANIGLNLFENWYTFPFLVLFTIIVGLMAGSYPSLFLSSFNPYEAISGSLKGREHKGLLRRVLVVFQFSVSILLIIGTVIMYRQIKYMLNKDIGFNKEQIIVIKKAETLGKKLKVFKEVVKDTPGVIGIVGSTAVPGRNNNTNRYVIESGTDKELWIETNYVDNNFLQTYGMTLVSGRTFNESGTPERQVCVINESALKETGLTDPEKLRLVRKGFQSDSQPLQIVGVVKNFHFKSMHNQISPYLFCLNTGGNPGDYLSVKLLDGNYSKTIGAIENKWKDFTGNKSMEYYFIGDDFKQMYINERQNAQIAVIFSIIAIFIGSLGLFGLTSYAVEQRTREIGIRKALGSSVTGIYILICGEVIILVSIAALFAVPVIYYLGTKWLSNFAYRIDPGISIYISGIGIAIGIALLTISYRILRAARVNPAHSLKYE